MFGIGAETCLDKYKDLKLDRDGVLQNMIGQGVIADCIQTTKNKKNKTVNELVGIVLQGKKVNIITCIPVPEKGEQKKKK